MQIFTFVSFFEFISGGGSSLGCTVVTFMASYNNYPSASSLDTLHQLGKFTGAIDLIILFI